ncbi:hypothetical protein F4779DRAFT_591690 [Xylariaceae sp. FL0662B]|nr:hypothetical protein F4779DRAFT_591690 [Xylariaceae sp. FL0662B]
MSLGPLTTSFTPPADCLASTALYWVNTASTSYWLHGKPYQSSCFPANYSPYQDQYYTPGVCPGGYTQACGSLTSSGSALMTRTTCCPEGDYICAPSSSSYSDDWGPTLGCMSIFNTDLKTRFTTIADSTLAGSETAGEETTVKPPGTIMAYGIVVENSITTTTVAANTAAWTGRPPWANRGSWDGAHWSTAPSTPTPSGISETAPPTSTASPSSPSTAGLSTGAAVGIGVAAGVGVLGLASAIASMFWHRRRKRLAAQSASNTQSDESTMYDSPKAWVQVNWPPSEVAASREPGELTAEREPVEKDGIQLG